MGGIRCQQQIYHRAIEKIAEVGNWEPEEVGQYYIGYIQNHNILNICKHTVYLTPSVSSPLYQATSNQIINKHAGDIFQMSSTKFHGKSK